MINYKKTYVEHFGYCEQDYIPSELSGEFAVVVHHIQFGRGKKDNSIENLIALTYEEHQQAHDEKLSKEYLQEIHNKFIEKYNVNKS